MSTRHDEIKPEEVQYRTGQEIAEMQSQGVDWTAKQYGRQTGWRITVPEVASQIRLPELPRCNAIYHAYPDAIGARVVDKRDGYVHLDLLNSDGLVVGEATRTEESMFGVAERYPPIDY